MICASATNSMMSSSSTAASATNNFNAGGQQPPGLKTCFKTPEGRYKLKYDKTPPAVLHYAHGKSVTQILEGNGSSATPNALDEGKRLVVLVEESLNKKGKIVKKELHLEKIKQQFGKTMKVAAQNLNVSVSTLRRKWNKHVTEAKKKGRVVNSGWPGPNYMKRRVNGPDNGHREMNDEYNQAIEDTLAFNKNENDLIIKSEYAGDVIRSDIPMSSATFRAVEKQIGEELGLNHGAYKLKYRDEDGDWILLNSDKHMQSCIKSSCLHRTGIRLLVTDIRPN